MLIRVPSFNTEDLAPLQSDVEPTIGLLNRSTKFLLELLESLDGREVSAGSLAWLALWSRGWQVVRAAREAMEAQQRYVLVILQRAATELDLHTQLILEPVLQLLRLGASPQTKVKVSKQAQTRAEQQVCDRLVGYAAWCLDQDRRHLESARSSLFDVYDS